MLRPHRAADGALLRLRVPGGRLTAATLGWISAASVRHADGDIQLTSRANLQLRGVTTDAGGAVAAALVDRVVAAGLMPKPSHERVRNIVCSPLTGLLGGWADLRPLTRELDSRLCAAAELADLPGPFLFVLDDGRGDLTGLSADLGVRAIGDGSVRMLVGGMSVGPVVPLAAAAGALIQLARRFLAVSRAHLRSQQLWHVRELPLGGRELLSDGAVVDRTPENRSDPMPHGQLTQDDGHTVLSLLAPLGLLTAEQCAAVVEAAQVGSGALIVTPWRGLLVPDLAPADVAALSSRLTGTGLELRPDSSWRGITACTGAPRCAHGQGATRGLATAVAELRRAAGRQSAPVPVHVVGCERRCGSPGTAHVEVLNHGATVEIALDGGVVVLPPADAPAAVVAAGR